MQRGFSEDVGHSSVLEMKKSGIGRTLTNHKEDGISKPRTSALSRGTLKRKSGRNTIHFTADSENIEFMLRTIHSTNQLSMYGAVSSWCIDVTEKMHGQTSAGVDRSISEEMIGYQNNWIRKKLVLSCETNQGQWEPRETPDSL